MKIRIKILHVDDSHLDRKLVMDAFLNESEEFEITEVENLASLEQVMDKTAFDLVLTDFNIAGFSGFQVLQYVRSKNPEIPVIIVTGTGSEEIAVEAMKLGADDYVIKTVSHIRNLVPTVRNVLERARMKAEYKSTITALQESEERFRLLFETSMDAVMLTIPNGGVLMANPSASRIFGRTEEEIVKEGRAGIIDISDPRFALAINERAETGKFSGELTGLRGDGTKFPMEVTSALFRDKHGNLNSSMIIRDISERKASEEVLRKKLNQLEQFHRLTVGRELAMIDLKNEVNDLLQKLGLPKKY